MFCHICKDIILHFFFRHGFSVLKNDTSHYFFSVLFVGNTDYLHVFNLGMSVNKLFNFLRVNVLAAADYHILKTSCNSVIAFRRLAGKVSCVQPAVLINSSGCRLWHLIVSLHDVVSTGNKFSGYAYRQFFACLRINDLTLNFRKRSSNRSDTNVKRIVSTAHRTSRRRFCLSVNNGYFRHMHFIDNVLHYRNRARTSRHYSGTHIAEIGLGEVFMLKHSDKHGGYAVECSYAFAVYAGERRLGREIRQGQNC